MIKYILLLPLFLLTSCGYNATPTMIENAENLCKNNTGLQKIYLYGHTTFKIYCNNGAIFYQDVKE